MWECDVQGYAKKAEYCCESAGEGHACCSTSTNVFPLPSATLGAYTGLPVSWAATATRSTNTVLTGSSGTATGVTKTGGTAIATTTSQADSQAASNEKAKVIGASVGGVVGAFALIGCVAFLLIRRRKQDQSGLRAGEEKAFLVSQRDFEGEEQELIYMHQDDVAAAKPGPSVYEAPAYTPPVELRSAPTMPVSGFGAAGVGVGTGAMYNSPQAPQELPAEGASEPPLK